MCLFVANNQVRWRALSNNKTPAATATFRLSAMPLIGMLTRRSASSSSSADNPVDSGPRIKALGTVQSSEV